MTQSWRATRQGPARTSALLAPTMLLTGHAGEVFTAKFSPDGTVVASGSHDKHVFLWRTYGECENYMMLQGTPRLLSAGASGALVLMQVSSWGEQRQAHLAAMACRQASELAPWARD